MTHLRNVWRTSDIGMQQQFLSEDDPVWSKQVGSVM